MYTIYQRPALMKKQNKQNAEQNKQNSYIILQEHVTERRFPVTACTSNLLYVILETLWHVVVNN